MFKRFNVLIIVFSLVLMLSACGGKQIKNPYVREYVTGQGNITGNVDKEYYAKINDAFEIGASENGYAVFKDPDSAFDTLKELYSDVIEVIQKEFNLQKFNKKNYVDYKTYGWQVTDGSAEEKEQAKFISKFLDIYENSFK